MAIGRRVHRRTRATRGVRSRAVVLGACGLLAIGVVVGVARPAAPAAAQGAPAGVTVTNSQLSALTALDAALTGARAAAATPATGTTAAGATADATTIPTQPYSDCTNTDGKPYATGLPPLPCLLFPSQAVGKFPTAWTDNGALFDDIVQQVLRAKLVVPFDKTVSRLFTVLCTAPDGPRPCPSQFAFTYPPVGSPYRSGFFGTVGYGFLQSPIGDNPQYGVVTRKDIGLYGFGSIPSSATLTVSQPVVNGVVDPLVLAYPSFTPLYTKGTIVTGYEQFGPCCGTDPTTGAERPGPAQLDGDLSITGPVTISVSNVKLDGVPLDVGSNCHTTTTLSLTAKGGWVPPGTKPVEFYPGEYQPFNPPSYVHGGQPGVDPDPSQTVPAGYHYTGVDVPSFTDCVSSTGDDVSALISGLASGNGNPLDLTQKTSFVAFGCLAGTTTGCSSQHPAVVDPDKVVVPKPPA